MGTLASELASHADRIASGPRIYADANVPARLVEFMRTVLGWDVFFVIEEPALRRAADIEHFRLSCQLRRTLITLDRDYLDDRQFPPAEGSGVLVLSAPNDSQMQALLTRVDRILFNQTDAGRQPLPLAGAKLQVHTDWRRDAE